MARAVYDPGGMTTSTMARFIVGIFPIGRFSDLPAESAFAGGVATTRGGPEW
jgi:hypothetical protein